MASLKTDRDRDVVHLKTDQDRDRDVVHLKTDRDRNVIHFKTDRDRDQETLYISTLTAMCSKMFELPSGGGGGLRGPSLKNCINA